MIPGVKSKPVYAPLAADVSGRYHLLLGMGQGSACLVRVLRELQAFATASRQRTQVLFASAVVAGLEDDPFKDLEAENVVLFEESTALLERARSILERSLMGTRVYIAGPESFIGRVLQLTATFNLNKDEIRAEHAGSSARRVHCVHCRASTEDVRTNIVRCAGCTRWLLVRDHYSRRLAAYMGVMVDAEAPGELPPIREIYS
jgi:dimethylamine monooxygenase subunit C